MRASQTRGGGRTRIEQAAGKAQPTARRPVPGIHSWLVPLCHNDWVSETATLCFEEEGLSRIWGNSEKAPKGPEVTIQFEPNLRTSSSQGYTQEMFFPGLLTEGHCHIQRTLLPQDQQQPVAVPSEALLQIDRWMPRL